MYCTRNVSDSVVWVGASDRRLALFENLFPILRGVSYNSYLILDEKTALLDTTDASVTRQYLENVSHSLNGKPLDYLIFNHMEPDHCANIAELLLRYPHLTLVGNAKTFAFVSQFYDLELNGHLFADEVNFDRDWLDDARRYYCNIVGKYGIQVQAALKKLSALSIRTICPLHGPVWRENLEYLLSKYDLWSRYVPEDNAVAIFYASMYGDTENAANILAAGLAEGGIKNIALYDVSVTDVSVLIAEAFRCSHLVFAAPTYNNGVYPAMYNFLHDMGALSLQNRTIGLIENGTWGPVSAKQMQQLFSEMKQMNVLEPVVTVKSSVKEDSLAALCALKDRILASCTK